VLGGVGGDVHAMASAMVSAMVSAMAVHRQCIGSALAVHWHRHLSASHKQHGMVAVLTSNS
jgi:hypothetical protein